MPNEKKRNSDDKPKNSEEENDLEEDIADADKESEEEDFEKFLLRGDEISTSIGPRVSSSVGSVTPVLSRENARRQNEETPEITLEEQVASVLGKEETSSVDYSVVLQQNYQAGFNYQNRFGVEYQTQKKNQGGFIEEERLRDLSREIGPPVLHSGNLFSQRRVIVGDNPELKNARRTQFLEEKRRMQVDKTGFDSKDFDDGFIKKDKMDKKYRSYR